MSLIATESTNYIDIANKIREKTGNSTQYKPSEMPSGIEEVAETVAVNEKEKLLDTLWEAIQDGGNRRDYSGAFCSFVFGTEDYFRPKYDIISYNSSYMFAFFDALTDLRELETKFGVRLNTAGSYWATEMFRFSSVEIVGEIDLALCFSFGGVFEAAETLHTIEKLIISKTNQQSWNRYAFAYSTMLQNIKIDGVIRNSIWFSDQDKLTKESLLSIMQSLERGGGNKTCTFNEAMQSIIESDSELLEEMNKCIENNWSFAYEPHA